MASREAMPPEQYALTDDYVAAHKPDQVLFVIMTDGQENASREFSRSQVMHLIEDRQVSADYEFIYLGANQDSYQVGRSMGIAPGRTLDYDASPVVAAATMDRLSVNVKSHRRSGERRSAPASPSSKEMGRMANTRALFRPSWRGAARPTWNGSLPTLFQVRGCPN